MKHLTEESSLLSASVHSLGIIENKYDNYKKLKKNNIDIGNDKNKQNGNIIIDNDITDNDKNDVKKNDG